MINQCGVLASKGRLFMLSLKGYKGTVIVKEARKVSDMVGNIDRVLYRAPVDIVKDRS